MPIPPRANRPVVLEDGHPPKSSVIVNGAIVTGSEIAPLNAELSKREFEDVEDEDSYPTPKMQAPDLGVKTASRKMEPSLIVVEDVLAMLERMKGEYASRGYRFEFDISFSLKRNLHMSTTRPNVRLMAHGNGKATNIKTTTTAPGTLYDVDANNADLSTLTANGWARLGFVGPTASRPDPNSVQLGAGTHYIDTTLTQVVVWDGFGNWRNPFTGAVA